MSVGLETLLFIALQGIRGGDLVAAQAGLSGGEAAALIPRYAGMIPAPSEWSVP